MEANSLCRDSGRDRSVPLIICGIMHQGCVMGEVTWLPGQDGQYCPRKSSQVSRFAFAQPQKHDRAKLVSCK